MTTAWSHLLNAKHIDRVLASMTTNPEKWRVVRNAAWNAALGVARDAVSSRASPLQISWGAAWDAVWYATNEVAWNEAWDTAWDVIWTTARESAWGVIVALIAYDDCAYMLDSDVNEIKILSALGDSRAILLLPACMVFNEMEII